MRIEQLTRVTKNVKAPSMRIFVKPEFNQNMDWCQALLSNLFALNALTSSVHGRIPHDPLSHPLPKHPPPPLSALHYAATRMHTHCWAKVRQHHNLCCIPSPDKAYA